MTLYGKLNEPRKQNIYSKQFRACYKEHVHAAIVQHQHKPTI